jgi:hypothetical protein
MKTAVNLFNFYIAYGTFTAHLPVHVVVIERILTSTASQYSKHKPLPSRREGNSCYNVYKSD